MADKDYRKTRDENYKTAKELAHNDEELAWGIFSAIVWGVNFGVDVLETLKALSLPKEELKTMYAGAGRYPNIFLAAIILREVRDKRKDKDSSQ